MAIESQEFGHAVGPSSSSCKGNPVTVYSTDAYEMRLVAGVFGPRGRWIFLGRDIVCKNTEPSLPHFLASRASKYPEVVLTSEVKTGSPRFATWFAPLLQIRRKLCEWVPLDPSYRLDPVVVEVFWGQETYARWYRCAQGFPV
jgi:hypothetical protein